MKTRYEMLILAILMVCAFSYVFICNWYDNDYQARKHEQPARSRADISGSYDPELLTHRLINFDRRAGIASEKNANLAFGNTQDWLSDVKKHCDTALSNKDFLACANRLLGKHFYYSSVQAVSDGWARHYSDCDLNAYLLIDAMHAAGREAEIVYAPHHAFISYRDEKTHEPLYWETTSDYNTGQPADLRLDFYRKTPSRFYYTPESAAYAENIYPALVIDKIPSEERRKALLNSLRHQFPDNPAVQDAWYEQKSVITRDDALSLISELKTDITSVSKRILLIRYFSNHLEEEKAQQLLNEISDEDCNDACLKLKSQRSVIYRLAGWSLARLDALNIRLSLSVFFSSIRDSLILCGLILLASVTGKLLQKYPIKIGKKDNRLPPQPQDTPAG